MRFSCAFLFLALPVTPTAAQDVEVDPDLPSYRRVAGVAGVVRGHSSAGMSDLMTIWRAGFQRIYPSVRIELDDASIDLGVGGAATFGPWLGAAGPPSVWRFKRRFGHAPLEIPVCFYVLAVYVHKDNPYRTGLRIAQVDTIFSPAFWDVRWGDLGCGGKWVKRPIRLYAPPYLHPDTLLHECLGRVEIGGLRLPAFVGFKDSVKRCTDETGVVTSVAGDTHGMGLASIGCRTDKVRALAIARRGSSEFVSATADNANNGSYPLAHPFYLNLNHDPQGGFELDPLRREFLRYILSREGQQAVIEAGHVPLSAEIADRALAKARVTRSGEGSWDRMIRRLRVRRLARRQHMGRIEGLARAAGDQPTEEQLMHLANTLASTGFTSAITFQTEEKGATVKYRLIGQPEAVPTDEPTNRAKATVPIGLYHVWTERDGEATSPMDAWFPIVRERERIKICEARTDLRGTAARILRATVTYLAGQNDRILPWNWTPEARERIVDWFGELIRRVEVGEPIDYARMGRELKRELDSLEIHEGDLRRLCVEMLRGVSKLAEGEGK